MNSKIKNNTYLDFDINKEVIITHNCHEIVPEWYVEEMRFQSRLHALILLDFMKIMFEEKMLTKNEIDLTFALHYIIRSAGISPGGIKKMIEEK